MTDSHRRIILSGVVLGLAALFTASVVWRLGDHPLVRKAAVPSGMPAMPPTERHAASTDDGMQIMGLMQQMQGNPGNLEAMLELSRIFADKGDLDSSLEMLRRAEAAAPADPRPSYLAGVRLAAKGAWNDAAESLQRSIAIKDDASARFSLGVICRYHLGKDAEARSHWEQASRLCGDAGLAKLIADELAKLK